MRSKDLEPGMVVSVRQRRKSVKSPSRKVVLMRRGTVMGVFDRGDVKVCFVDHDAWNAAGKPATAAEILRGPVRWTPKPVEVIVKSRDISLAPGESPRGEV